jgi:hypothetical protein
MDTLGVFERINIGALRGGTLELKFEHAISILV